MMKSKKTLVLSVCLLLLPALVFGAGALDKYNLGMEAQANENFYVASQYYLEVTAENPAFTDAWYKLAECSYKLGEFDLALNYLENAEKYEKNNQKIQNLKGMVYVSLGRIDDGRAIFNSILKKYPNDIDAHFGLAEIELYDGKFSGAENQYAEALKRQNSNRKALLSLALVCAETKRYAQSASISIPLSLEMNIILAIFFIMVSNTALSGTSFSFL